jgi:NAD(P)-dependent dehydrogenase (short-subunit alcohol dehydrogenase family)
MGRGIALTLAAAGADVAVGALRADEGFGGSAYADRPNDADTEATKAAIEAHGVRAFGMPFDLRSAPSLINFHRQATGALGPISILVNAAGVCAQEAMLEARDETWTTVLDIDLTGAYRTARLCLAAMYELGWGRIVHIGSTAANVGFPGHAAYCAAKTGLLGLNRCIALEGAARGITSNVINPGAVGTGMMRAGSSIRVRKGQGHDVEENFRLVAEATPQKRLIEVAEIAALAAFLCRDESRGITGEAINVAGGALW